MHLPTIRVQYGENSQTRCPQSFTDSLQSMDSDVSNFSYPHIVDMADERHPRVVSGLRIEVDEPANCPLIQGDISPRSVALIMPAISAVVPIMPRATHGASPAAVRIALN